MVPLSDLNGRNVCSVLAWEILEETRCENRVNFLGNSLLPSTSTKDLYYAATNNRYCNSTQHTPWLFVLSFYLYVPEWDYIYTHTHIVHMRETYIVLYYLAPSFSDFTSASSLLIRFRHSQRRLSTGISTALNAVWREHTGQRIHFGSGRSFFGSLHLAVFTACHQLKQPQHTL